MNVDRILDEFNRHQVAYLLIGGMNFLLRHAPVLTYDVDLWLEDTPNNLERSERALVSLDADWGRTEQDWGPVSDRKPGWLATQGVFCLASPHGAIDIFRSVRGLSDWAECCKSAVRAVTPNGIEYLGLSDEDMLRCQLALPEKLRNPRRIQLLEGAVRSAKGSGGDG